MGCQNGGICIAKDECQCIQQVSILSKVERGLTGWTGTDCSMPICIQGFFDPTCNVSAAPGNEGCYRCANGGICVSPDVCQCADGWSGYDCRTPVCKAEATPLVRKQLMTIDERKIRLFEEDPCGMFGFSSLGNQGKFISNIMFISKAKRSLLTATTQDLEECAHFQTSALAIVKDPMMISSAKKLAANIAKLLLVILYFANEVSFPQTKYLAPVIATQAMKVLLIEMICLVHVI